MANRLLDRQVSLLEHLTSGAAIFGGGRDASADRPARASMAACFISRRASPTRSAWRRSSGCCRARSICWGRAGPDHPRFRRGLPAGEHRPARQCAPISRLSLGAVGGASRPSRRICPTWPRRARLRRGPQPARAGRTSTPQWRARRFGAIRRHPSVVLLRCAYDIRPILEGRAACSRRRPTRDLLAVAMPPGADDPLVSELSARALRASRHARRFHRSGHSSRTRRSWTR